MKKLRKRFFLYRREWTVGRRMFKWKKVSSFYTREGAEKTIVALSPYAPFWEKDFRIERR